MSPSYSVVALVILLLIAWFVTSRLTRQRSVVKSEVWAGGIPNLLPEMTYTATGFSNPVRVVFQAIFRPNIVEDTRETVAVHFRTAIRRRRDETHLVDRLFFRPIGAIVNSVARLLAGMHHGRLNAYVGYVLGFLILILVLYRIG
jgi:hydrogenase-4 component B